MRLAGQGLRIGDDNLVGNNRLDGQPRPVYLTLDANHGQTQVADRGPQEQGRSQFLRHLISSEHAAEPTSGLLGLTT